MISYAEVQELEPGERRDLYAGLFERSQTIWDLPEDYGKVEAWEELAADAARHEFPHLVATARFGQYVTLQSGGWPSEALDAYARLMQVIHRHGDLIAQANLVRQLGSVSTLTMTVADDPSIPLERISRIIDLVEQLAQRHGGDIAETYVARAAIAAATGDRAATLDWLDRARAEGSPRWNALDWGVIPMEISLIAAVDPARAAGTLTQRLETLGVDPSRLDPDHPEAESVIALVSKLGYLFTRLRRRAEADALADGLITTYGIVDVVEFSVPSDLIPVLDNRPADALVAVDFALRNTYLGETHWELTAATARSRILADPDGEEGHLLRTLADQAAAAHDRRGDTDLHIRTLQEYWWAGLPDIPRPALADDPAVWRDREERAERILAAGWLRRTPAVRVTEPPVAIKSRYVALGEEAVTLLEAETSADADALATRLHGRADQLRCANSLYAIPLMHGLRAGQNADVPALAQDYRYAQAQLLRFGDYVDERIRGLGDNTFSIVVQMSVADPAVPWAQIEDLVLTEERVREASGAPTAPLHLARAEIAAHRDELDALRSAVRSMQQALRTEEDRVDAPALVLDLVRLTAFASPGLAAASAQWVADVGDPAQVRAARAWLYWMGIRTGDPTAPTAMAELLASVDGDLEEFVGLPNWVLLEGVGRANIDLRGLLEAVIESNTEDDLQVTAATGSALLALFPDDPRGPEHRARAAEVARALDARNGNRHWTTFIGERWFGDPDFAARP